MPSAALAAPLQMWPSTTSALSETSLPAVLAAISGLQTSSSTSSFTWRPSTPPFALTSLTTSSAARADGMP